MRIDQIIEVLSNYPDDARAETLSIFQTKDVGGFRSISLEQHILLSAFEYPFIKDVIEALSKYPGDTEIDSISYRPQSDLDDDGDTVPMDKYLRAVEDLTEALRFTVEYVGTRTLPPRDGWSWWGAMRKYAPEKARKFRDS